MEFHYLQRQHQDATGNSISKLIRSIVFFNVARVLRGIRKICFENCRTIRSRPLLRFVWL